MRNLNAHPSTTTPPPPLEEMDEESAVGDETDGVMERIQCEVGEGEGEVEVDGDGEGEGEGEWFIDSRLLQKDFISKQYSTALSTFGKVRRSNPAPDHTIIF